MTTDIQPNLKPASLRSIADYMQHIANGMPQGEERRRKEQEARDYRAAADKAVLP